MAHELPEFSDDLAHCDPCGWPEADTEYFPASIAVQVNEFGGFWPAFAFLKRTCTRCRFEWAEAPLLPRQTVVPERSSSTILRGQSDCQGQCCGGRGPMNYSH